MANINEEILDEDPESLVVEADEDTQYEPDTDSNVVIVEPLVITKGRAIRKKFLKNE